MIIISHYKFNFNQEPYGDEPYGDVHFLVEPYGDVHFFVSFYSLAITPLDIFVIL